MSSGRKLSCSCLVSCLKSDRMSVVTTDVSLDLRVSRMLLLMMCLPSDDHDKHADVSLTLEMDDEGLQT